MIKLHYAELDLKENIPAIEFTNKKTYRYWVSGYDKINSKSYKIYLIAIFDEIYVTSNIRFVYSYLMDCEYGVGEIGINDDVFLFEFKSYEDAYLVALNMREESKFCYN